MQVQRFGVGYAMMRSSVRQSKAIYWIGIGVATSWLAWTASPVIAQDAEGVLEFRANGEDLVRRGFVSKDGWTIHFQNLYLNLADIAAYQMVPANTSSGVELQTNTQIALPHSKTIDLAAGDDIADPIKIGSATAPVGRYNALSWSMLPAPSGPAAGYSLLAIGNARKGDRQIDFEIGIDRAQTFTCGDYVGDERKGIVKTGQKADVEMTVHIDHVFGDASLPSDDGLNVGALGFEPLVALADDHQLVVDSATLEDKLSDTDLANWQQAIASLGHVGEGHCEVSPAEGGSPSTL